MGDLSTPEGKLVERLRTRMDMARRAISRLQGDLKAESDRVYAAERERDELKAEVERLRAGDWQMDAFDETLKLAEDRDMGFHAHQPDDASLTYDHIRDMRRRITADFSPAKLGRWLGWAQAAVVASGAATLEEMKLLNKAASDRAALRNTEESP